LTRSAREPPARPAAIIGGAEFELSLTSTSWGGRGAKPIEQFSFQSKQAEVSFGSGKNARDKGAVLNGKSFTLTKGNKTIECRVLPVPKKLSSISLIVIEYDKPLRLGSP